MLQALNWEHYHKIGKITQILEHWEQEWKINPDVTILQSAMITMQPLVSKNHYLSPENTYCFLFFGWNKCY